MYNNNTKELNKNQMEVLVDKDKNGKERPWRDNKLKTLDLSESFMRIGKPSKAFRIKNCSNQLIFKVNTQTGEKKLHSMISCQVRLCSMCNWRRSKKIYGQVSKVMDKALENEEYRFLFATLTCKNVQGYMLSSTVDALVYANKKFMLKTNVKRSVKGWFRALEVTHDVNELITREMWYGNKEKHIKPRAEHYKKHGLKIGDRNPNYNTYHPHFHVIFMVSKRYFKEKELYISQEEWTSLWKDCLGVDYTPKVDIRAFKTNNKAETTKSVAESAKYTVKDNDYLIPDNKPLTDSTVEILDSALANRRLVAFGGELKKIHKTLNLDDIEKGDLVHVDDEEDDGLREDVNYMFEVYNWNVGYSQYVKMEGDSL